MSSCLGSARTEIPTKKNPPIGMGVRLLIAKANKVHVSSGPLSRPRPTAYEPTMAYPLTGNEFLSPPELISRRVQERPARVASPNKSPLSPLSLSPPRSQLASERESEIAIHPSILLMRGRRGMPSPAGAVALDLVGVQIPYHFRCPISLELMRDPVAVSTGQTYDRSSIESWLAMGNTTCPVSRVPLTDFTLIPNHTLRRLIQDWCVAHRSHGVERIPTPKQPPDPLLIRRLLSQASASDADSETRVGALRRLRALARDSEKNRTVISTHETRSALVEISFGDGGDLDVAVEAMEALAVLPLTDSESVAVAAKPERVAWLAAVLREHRSIEARIGAAALVEGMRSAEARETVGCAPGVMEGLLALVEEKGNLRAVRVGVRGLFSLCLAKENRGRAVAAGAVAAVVRRLGEMCCGERGDLERALATVELLCRGEGGREAVVAVEGAVTALVRAMAGKATERAAEHAAGALVAVVAGSEALQKEAVAAGVVTQLLLMVQSGCSERARRKAQLLLKILRPAWSTQDSIANSDEFLQHF